MTTSGYMNNINLATWSEVEAFIDTAMSIKPSYFERAIQGNYPRDAFSKGQLASKGWLLQQLNSVVTPKPDVTVAILGCWIGSLVDPLLDVTSANRIYGLDLDPSAIELAEKFNQQHVQNSWRFKGVVADVSTLVTSDMEFETGGELINVRPDVVVNTSCEHMDTHWFETADSDQLIILQTNDSEGYDGHINTCANLDEVKQKYPMSQIKYAGQLSLPAYTRFMLIGYK